MALGPGKYDHLATATRTATQADAVILIVLGGTAGSGFSCQASAETTFRLPTILRELADKIEADFAGQGSRA